MNVVTLDTDINPIQILLASDDYNHKLGTSDFVFILPDTVKATPNHQMRVGLTSASVPVSFFNINATNNRLDMVYETVFHTVLLPFGNYNMGQFLTSANDSIKTVGFANLPTMTWNSATNKVSFLTTSSFILQKSSTCLQLLGFTVGIDHKVNVSVVMDASNNTLVSEFGGVSGHDEIDPGTYSKQEVATILTSKLNGNGYNAEFLCVIDELTDVFSIKFNQRVNNVFTYNYGSKTNISVYIPTGHLNPAGLGDFLENAFNAEEGADQMDLVYENSSFTFKTLEKLTILSTASANLFGLDHINNVSSYQGNHLFNYHYDGNDETLSLANGVYTITNLTAHITSVFNAKHGVGKLNVVYNGITNFFVFVTTIPLTIYNTSTCLLLFGLPSGVTYHSFTYNTEYAIISVNRVINNAQTVDGFNNRFVLNTHFPITKSQYVIDHITTLKLMASSSMLYQLGFPAGVEQSSVSWGGYDYQLNALAPTAFRASQTLTSNSMCDIRGYDTLHFKTDLFTAGHTYNASQKKTSNNILAQIPVDAGAYQTIQYRPSNPHLVDIKKNIINTFRIWIEDGNGTLVDFNGMKWTATLTIYFMKTRGLIQGNSQSKWGNTSYAGTGQGNNLNSLRYYIDEITKDYKRMGQALKIEQSSLV